MSPIFNIFSTFQLITIGV